MYCEQDSHTYVVKEEQLSQLSAFLRVAMRGEVPAHLSLFLSADTIKEFVVALADIVDFTLAKLDHANDSKDWSWVDIFLDRMMVEGHKLQDKTEVGNEHRLPFSGVSH